MLQKQELITKCAELMTSVFMTYFTNDLNLLDKSLSTELLQKVRPVYKDDVTTDEGELKLCSKFEEVLLALCSKELDRSGNVSLKIDYDPYSPILITACELSEMPLYKFSSNMKCFELIGELEGDNNIVITLDNNIIYEYSFNIDKVNNREETLVNLQSDFDKLKDRLDELCNLTQSGKASEEELVEFEETRATYLELAIEIRVTKSIINKYSKYIQYITNSKIQ